MVFHWILSNSKSPQVSRTRLRILAVLSSAVVWIVSTRPPTSKSSRPFNNPLVIVPKAPITIGTIVTFMFHSLFNSLASFEVLIFLFIFLQIYSVVRRDSKVDNFQMLIIIRSGLLAGIRWSVCMLKSHRSLCVSLSLLLLLLFVYVCVCVSSIFSFKHLGLNRIFNFFPSVNSPPTCSCSVGCSFRIHRLPIYGLNRTILHTYVKLNCLN